LSGPNDDACISPVTNVGVISNLFGGTFIDEGGHTFLADCCGGSPIFSNAGTYTKTGSGTTTTLTGIVFDNLDSGVLGGVGTIAANVANAGEVNPGEALDTAGTLAINGAYAQSPTGILTIDIGGPTPGAEHDRLTVSSPAALDGTLSVTLIAPFTPTTGQTFVVLTFASRTGDFVLGPEPDFTRTYCATSLTLTATGLPLLAPTRATTRTNAPATRPGGSER
jgi:hypothetical protein